MPPHVKMSIKHDMRELFLKYSQIEWVSDCHSTPNEQYFTYGYIKVRTSYSQGDGDSDVRFVLEQHA